MALLPVQGRWVRGPITARHGVVYMTYTRGGHTVPLKRTLDSLCRWCGEVPLGEVFPVEFDNFPTFFNMPVIRQRLERHHEQA